MNINNFKIKWEISAPNAVAKTTEKSTPRPNTLSEKTNKKVLEQTQAPIDRANKT